MCMYALVSLLHMYVCVCTYIQRGKQNKRVAISKKNTIFTEADHRTMEADSNSSTIEPTQRPVCVAQENTLHICHEVGGMNGGTFKTGPESLVAAAANTAHHDNGLRQNTLSLNSGAIPACSTVRACVCVRACVRVCIYVSSEQTYTLAL